MLKIKELIKDKSLYPRRYYSLNNNKINNRQYFAINEFSQDYLNLMMSLNYIETQKPSVKNIEFETHYDDEFLEIKENLELLFNVLTNRPIHILIKKGVPQGSFLPLSSTRYKDLLLLSGGVDSISGAIKYSNYRNLAYLHVNSNKEIFGKVRKLMDIPPLANRDIYYIDTKMREITHNSRSAFSETRGLLFLSSAAILLDFFGGRNAIFCENGAQMFDIMLDSDVYTSSKATKNTNYKYLELIQRFLKNTYSNFHLEYPFMTYTKAEMIAKFLDPNLLFRSWSCYNMYFSHMCGSCWNCFVTRMSCIAAGLNSNLNYRQNIFIDTYSDRTYLGNQNIMLDMMRFYHDLLNNKQYAVNITYNYKHIYNKVYDLMYNFALDLFLGVRESINYSYLNGFGRKVYSFSESISKNELLDRKSFLEDLKY